MLSTPRLKLGPIEVGDTPLIHRWKNDQEIQRMSSDEPHLESMKESEQRVHRWIHSDPDAIIHFAIRLQNDGALIGFAHLAEIDRLRGSCHLGIVIGDKERWGQGFGTEAVQALLRHAFLDQKFRRVAAEAFSNNPRSIGMLERAGFRREEVVPKSERQQGSKEEYLYGLSAGDLSASSGIP